MPKRPSQAAMLRQIQKMQEDMENAQQSLETETVEVSVGGGAITVVITGHQRVQDIKKLIQMPLTLRMRNG